MKLSIIVPVYNMAADNKLNFCMDSLINQTIDDYEIVAVDDCSSDESPVILRTYEEKYPDKVKVIYSKENLKQGGAKNKGLKVAQGEWIGFIDSDDWITPDMYEKLIKRAEDTGADVVGCDLNLVTEHSFDIGSVISSNKEEQSGVLDVIRKRSLILDGGSLCTKIYKRERIIKDGLYFPEGIFYEDNAVGNSYLVMAEHFEYVKEPLYYYYQHSASTVHTITKTRCEDRLAAGRIMIKEAKERGYYEDCKEELDYKFIMLFYLNTVFPYVRQKGATNLKFIKNIGKELEKTVPAFRDNKYFVERINEEEKRMLDLQLKSTFLFYIYYKALWCYRKLRTK